MNALSSRLQTLSGSWEKDLTWLDQTLTQLQTTVPKRRAGSSATNGLVEGSFSGVE